MCGCCWHFRESGCPHIQGRSKCSCVVDSSYTKERGNQPRRKSSQECDRGDNVQVNGNKTSKAKIQDGTLKAISVKSWIKWKSMHQVPTKCWKLHTNAQYHNLKDHYLNKGGHMVAQLVETLRYKPEGCGFDSRWCHWNFDWHNPSGCTMALGLTQPLTEMSTRNISWGVKVAGA